ncbi:Fe-S oxidoreductase [Pyrodictium occultum]|uniref:Fe-S oxidoreductase n=1 Tax=Pyrodictium occultum TaxID=2309 RepID=A0A0V8RU80_PYROC|nr:(Fe-S)-binding protein [Pyrodictium occultum]KSW11625.1 Fe-S oxidoreductase [Pyrodictium occultum]
MSQEPPASELQKLIEQVKASIDWEGFDKERVEKAIRETLASLDPVKLHYLENCVGCAACAPACPYYPVSEKYGPVEKAELARHIYRKEATILGKLFGPLLNARKPKSAKDLDEIVEALYRCTNCGACYVSCPFGIDSGAIIRSMLGSIATKSGRVPTLIAIFEVVERERLFLKMPALMQIWSDVMKKAEQAIGKPLPYDKKGAEYFLLVNLSDVMFYPDGVIGAIKILDRAGLDWTLPSKPLAFRPPIAAVIALSKQTKETLTMLDSDISSYNPKNVVVLDGGFVYPWMRFELPKALGRRPSYRVLHIVELLAKLIREGRLKLKPSDDKVTWHDPCQLARRGGVTEEPNLVLSAASKGFRKLPHHGAESYCCGGGGGIGCMNLQMIEEMAKLVGMPPEYLLKGEKEKRFVEKTMEAWSIAVKRKIDDIRRSGAKIVVTACPVCMHSIAGGAQLYGLNIEVKHIAAYVAERLE